jgi:hypothetical protein
MDTTNVSVQYRNMPGVDFCARESRKMKRASLTHPLQIAVVRADKPRSKIGRAYPATSKES